MQMIRCNDINKNKLLEEIMSCSPCTLNTIYVEHAVTAILEKNAFVKKKYNVMHCRSQGTIIR